MQEAIKHIKQSKPGLLTTNRDEMKKAVKSGNYLSVRQNEVMVYQADRTDKTSKQASRLAAHPPLPLY